MSNIAVHVENLGKRYRIGGKQAGYKTLRETIVATATAPARAMNVLRQSGRAARSADQTFWALKDVSFDVPLGSVIGIIGRNGAGKSTLLKILSRITEPTEGLVTIRGRVGSLLEVGTGFHPELTGRENIYLNGSILGMRKSEIEAKFDEIVAFSEVEDFIDTPVKRYSSGMQTRLAFAVAAHLEPEILVVDEVLAVGDIQFQKKCLGKMGEVAKQGRTVLFVSHQMNQVRRLCDHCIWLVDGRLHRLGTTHEIVSAYEAEMLSIAGEQTSKTAFMGKARFLGWELVQPSAEDRHMLRGFGPVDVKFTLQVGKPIQMGVQGIALYNAERQLMWGTTTQGLTLAPGQHEIHYRLDSLPLKPGPYYWLMSLFDADGLVEWWDAWPQFVVATEPLSRAADEWAGLLNIPYTIEVQNNGVATMTQEMTVAS